MFVRVWDKAQDRYYKSVVYALVQHGWFEHAVVYNPYTNCFEHVRYLEGKGNSIRPNFEVIQTERNGWVDAGQEALRRAGLILEGRDVEYLSGYRDVVENFDFIARLLEDEAVNAKEAGVQLRMPEDAQEWKYISTQADANAFMEMFAGFHDALLRRLVYDEEFPTYNLTAVFDNSAWYGVVELCFERVVVMRLRPAAENYDNYIYGGTLIVKDESVFWADDSLHGEDLSYDGCYIKALSLKWRRIG